jgi:predicted PurR-regulated permease PerM
LAILISYILLFALLLTGFIIVVPFIINQSAVLISIFLEKIKAFQHLLQEKGLIYVIQNTGLLPQYFKNLLIELLKNNDFLEGFQSLLQKNISELAKIGTTYVKNVGEIAVGIIGKFLSVIFQIIFVFVIAVFFSLEKKKVINFIASLSGNKEYVRYKFEQLYYRLGNWLKGQLLMCLFIGIAVYLGLWILSFF